MKVRNNSVDSKERQGEYCKGSQYGQNLMTDKGRMEREKVEIMIIPEFLVFIVRRQRSS
jgi:hypothetical protein